MCEPVKRKCEHCICICLMLGTDDMLDNPEKAMVKDISSMVE